MKAISRKTHGLLDYGYGLLAVLLPWILRFEAGTERWVMVVVGVLIIAYSLMTDYELGVVRGIPFNLHLVADICLGLILILLPLLQSFSVTATWTYIILGLVSVVVAALTRGGRRTAYPDVEVPRDP